MKYICFGYLDLNNWNKKSPSEQNELFDKCFDYDEQLNKNGHWVSGEALKGPENATTLRYQNGKTLVTDGPYAETKELLGGLLVLEAQDLNQAIRLISHHPGIQLGAWEIRPAADLVSVVDESRERRNAAVSVGT